MKNDETRPAFPFVRPETTDQESGPPMPPPAGSDWDKFLLERGASSTPAIDLAMLKAGDRLAVDTKNTRYELVWLADGSVYLSTNRTDRPSGQVQVIGCAMGRVGPVKPGVLFCGGNLEYLSADSELRFRTTTIRALAMLGSSAQSA
jgi:hypothetical protein